MSIITSLSPNVISAYCREKDIVPFLDNKPFVISQKTVIIITNDKFNRTLPETLRGDISLVYCVSRVLAAEIAEPENDRYELIKYICEKRSCERRIDWPDPISTAIQKMTKDQIISWYNTFLYTLPNSSRGKLKRIILDIFQGKTAPQEIMTLLKPAYKEKGAYDAADSLIKFLTGEGSFYHGILNRDNPVRNGQHSGMTNFEFNYFVKLANTTSQKSS